MPPPDYFIMNGCPVDCADCQLPSCSFDLESEFDEDEDIEICNYTGEECIGDPMFCEECVVTLVSGEETKKRIDP